MGARRAVLAAAACLTVPAGCGGTPPPAASHATDRVWSANVAGVIDQLGRDVLVAASGGGTVAAARLALASEADLYLILVAYTDFGGCRHMVASAGAAPARFARVEQTLSSACVLLQRAAALFTRATRLQDAGALVRAGAATRRASPLLLQAKAELDAGS